MNVLFSFSFSLLRLFIILIGKKGGIKSPQKMSKKLLRKSPKNTSLLPIENKKLSGVLVDLCL